MRITHLYLEDQTNLHRHAARNAQDAIRLARERAHAFDVETAQERKNVALSGDKKFSDIDEALAPESSSGTPNVTQAPIVDCS